MSLADIWHRVVSLAAAEPLLGRLLLASIELAALTAFVWLLLRIGRVRSARLASLLWLLVLAKPVVSLLVGSPLPIVVFNSPAYPDSQVDKAAASSNESAEPQHTRRHATGQHDALPEDQLAWSPSNVRAGAQDKSIQSALSGLPASDTSTNRWTDVSGARLALVLWLCGVVFFTLRSLIDRLRLRRILAAAQPADAQLMSRYRTLIHRAAWLPPLPRGGRGGLFRLARWRVALLPFLQRCIQPPPPRLLVTDRLESPALVGTLVPVVLVPDWLAREADTGRLDWALRHELAHHKHRDPLAAAVRELAQILFYFYPTTWWAGREWHEAAELACDRALVHNDADAQNYAEQLYQILLHTRTHHRPALTPGLFATRTQIGRRIEALLSGVTSSTAKPSKFAMACVLSFAALSFAVGAGLHGDASDERTAAPIDSTTRPVALQDESTGEKGQQTDPPPLGVVRVFGSERLRTWRGGDDLTVTPDGNTILVNEWDRLTAFGRADGRRLHTIEQQGTHVSSYAITGNHIAIGTEEGNVEIWQIAPWTTTLQFNAGLKPIIHAQLLRDGTTLVTCSMDRTIKQWDIRTREMIDQRTWDYGADPVDDEVSTAVSPDERYLLCGIPGGDVKVYELATDNLARTLQAHERDKDPKSRVLDLAFSTDGKLLATCGHDGTAKIWAFPSGELLQTIRPDRRGSLQTPTCVAFSPDQSTLAVGLSWAPTAGEIELRDVKTGLLQAQLQGHTGGIGDVTFTQDGSSLVSIASDNAVKLWDTTTLAQRQPMPAHGERVHGVAFSPDGKLLATAGSDIEGTIRLWEVATGRLAESVQFEPSPLEGTLMPGGWKVAFSPDGTWLAAAGVDIHLWRRPSGRHVLKLVGGVRGQFAGVAFSPDGRYMASAGLFAAGGKVAVHDLSTLGEVFATDTKFDVGVYGTGLVLSDSGQLIMHGCGVGIKGWDLRTGNEIFNQPKVTRCVASPADGRTLAVAFSDLPGIRILETKTGDEIGTVDTQLEYIEGLAYSPDGRLLAVADPWGHIELWEPAAKVIRQTWKFPRVESLAFSPDGRYLATANANGTAYLLDMQQP